MPKSSVGLKIGSSRASMVRLRGGFKTAEVDRVETVRFSDFSNLVPEALQHLRLGAEDTTVASLDGEKAFFRLVSLPFTDKKRAEQSAPLEAEESLPFPLEQLYTSEQMVGKAEGSSKVMVVAALAETVHSLYDTLKSAGVTPSYIDADAAVFLTLNGAAFAEPGNRILLEIDDNISQCGVFSADGYKGFYVLPGSGGIDWLSDELSRILSLLDEDGYRPDAIFISGPGADSITKIHLGEHLPVRVEMLPFPSRLVSAKAQYLSSWPYWSLPLGLALREISGKNTSEVNLMQGELAPRKTGFPLKKGLILAGVYTTILIVLWGAGAYIDISQKSGEVEAIQKSTRALFTSNMPGVTNIEDEVNQMQKAVTELEEREKAVSSIFDSEISPLTVLREVSSKIPKEPVTELRDFIAEAERLRLEGTTTSFDAIDKIKAHLQEYPRFGTVTVSDAKSGTTADSVIFKMTVQYSEKKR
jgi:general secretion pathway protein L